jgi:hypothetical protein
MGVQNKNESRPAFFSAGYKKRDWDWWECLKMRELEGDSSCPKFRNWHVPASETAIDSARFTGIHPFTYLRMREMA